MHEYFKSLEDVIAPEMRRRCELAKRDCKFARAELLFEQPWDYLRQWRLECYPRQEITEWTRLSLRLWMIFVERRFLIRGAVEWHLPFTYGDATHPRSLTEYQTPEIWGDGHSTVEEYTRTSQASFLQFVPQLYEAFEKATERGRPSVHVEAV